MPISKYITEIGKIYKQGNATEHTYRGTLTVLLESLGGSSIIATNEPTRIDCGAPDYIITRKNIPLGYVEAKDIGKDLNSKSYAEQFNRYKHSLNNLIITDYLDFQFYKDGEYIIHCTIAESAGGKITPLPQNFDTFKNLMSSFYAYKGQSIKSASKLAKSMADKARLLGEVIKNALNSEDDNYENQSLQGQLEAFRKVLIHDLEVNTFADIYAQTIAYGMFAGRLHDKTLESFSRQEACECIPKSNPFLRRLFSYIAGTDIDDRIKWIVDDLAELFSYTDVAVILKDFGKATKMQDPIIHFYETFLSEYDPKLRKTRGVWYTPQPVVNFIVRAVDELLQSEFGLNGGLADTSKTTIDVELIGKASTRKTGTTTKTTKKEIHKVQVLDPATGTGTFLAEVIRQVHAKYANMQGVWNNYVDEHLLPRVHGFELLMASYAMAHLKLDMLLQETSYEAKNNKRLGVYLTNSLEDAHPDTGTLFATWLAQEATEANYVKQDVPVMVVLGNPPYSGESANKGVWIMDLMDAYKKEPTGEPLRERNPKWINDDYVKFIRYAEHYIEKNQQGIVAYISNHSFLDNPTFRGMRWHLLNTFDKIYIINLHGNAKKKETSPDGSKDENVFDIMQGVSINVFVKTGGKKKKSLADVYYCDLWGKRKTKYETLADNSLLSMPFEKINYAQPYYFFIPKDFTSVKEYDSGFCVQDLFRVNSVGIVTARDNLTIHSNPQEVFKTIQDFISLQDEEARVKYVLGKDVRDWAVKWAKQDLRQSGVDTNNIVPISYRPFDARFTYYTGKTKGFHCYPRNEVMQHMLTKDNLGLMLCKQFKAFNDYHHVFITKYIFESSLVSNKTSEISYGFPLYTYDKLSEVRLPNFNTKVIDQIAASLKMQFVPEETDATGTFAPIDLLDYIYAVLHSPAYRTKYKEFLKIDFPKIPYPKNTEKFWALVALGGQLRQIHLLESNQLNTLSVGFPENGNSTVDKIKYDAGRVYINDTQYFNNVPEIAWQFYIGGYQPAQKWLKDRKGRELSFDDIQHYAKIVNALYLTDELMLKIDEI